MPIKQGYFGIHRDVLFLHFGTGDIAFSAGKDPESLYSDKLIFTQEEPHVIGEEMVAFEGKSSDEMPNIKMVMTFAKPESIDALIISLTELRDQLCGNYSAGMSDFDFSDMPGYCGSCRDEIRNECGEDEEEFPYGSLDY